jgi:hypothetical protein
MTLPTLDETEEFVNAMYYGESGGGKTTAAAHMAKLGHVVYVNAEAGLKAKPLRRLGIPTANLHPYTVTCYSDLDKLYWSTKAQLEREPESLAGVVFDSMTEIQKKLVESIVDERHDRRSKTMEDDPFQVDRDDYGKMTEMVRRVSRRFRDLPCHTAFVCLDKRDVDNDGVVYRPALTPKFASDLVGYVDIAIYAAVGHGDEEDRSRYTGITRPIGKYRGKDRFGALPPHMANPTFDRVVEYVESTHDHWFDHAKEDPFQIARNKRLGLDESDTSQ